MDTLIAATEAADALPVPAEVRDALLEPFITATTLTLREMAGIDAAARPVYRKPQSRTLGDVSVVLGLVGPSDGSLVLSFLDGTARSLARRVLGGAVERLEDDLVRDCAGEVANVIAGQAKTLLVGSPYHFTFSTPTVIAGPHHEVRNKKGLSCFVIVFGSDAGEFALQVCLGTA